MDFFWLREEKFDFPVTKEIQEHLLQIKRILFTFTFSLQNKGTVNCFEKSTQIYASFLFSFIY